MTSYISTKILNTFVNQLSQYKCSYPIINNLILPIIHINNCSKYINIWNYAVEIGSLELIILLHQNNIPGCTKNVMDYAA